MPACDACGCRMIPSYGTGDFRCSCGHRAVTFERWLAARDATRERRRKFAKLVKDVMDMRPMARSN